MCKERRTVRLVGRGGRICTWRADGNGRVGANMLIEALVEAEMTISVLAPIRPEVEDVGRRLTANYAFRQFIAFFISPNRGLCGLICSLGKLVSAIFGWFPAGIILPCWSSVGA